MTVGFSRGGNDVGQPARAVALSSVELTKNEARERV
jgi:hypothetical protein